MNKTLEYYMNLPYRLEIVPDREEGGYTAYYPDLPGCITCSDTMNGLIANMEDAKKAWLEAALADNLAIQEARDIISGKVPAKTYRSARELFDELDSE